MASTYTFNTSAIQYMNYNGRYFQVSCTQIKHQDTNTSDINWQFIVTGGSEDSIATGPITLKINGTTVYSEADHGWSYRAFPTKKGSTSGTITGISHDSATGAKSITIDLKGSIFYSEPVDAPTQTWVLDAYPRQSTISLNKTSADFGSNITISINKPISSYTNTLSYKVGSGAETTIVSKTSSSSYTWTLPDASTFTTGKSTTITVYCTTYNGNTQVGSKTSATLIATINEAANKPSLTYYSCYDSNSVTTALTKDASGTIIRGYSNLFYDVRATFKNGANNKNFNIISSSYTKETTTASATQLTDTVSNIQAGAIIAYITDSRGFQASNKKTFTVVYYSKPTVNKTEILSFTGEGDATIKITGTFYNGKFGNDTAESNILTVDIWYKANGSDTWQHTTATPSQINKNGNSYTANIIVNGLDYTKGYSFMGAVKDSLETDSIYGSITKANAKPIFSWDSDDFKFEVPVYDKNNQELSPLIYDRYGANKFEFLNPSSITVEYKQGTGSWTSYTTENSDKGKLVSSGDKNFYLGKRNSDHIAGDQLRITFSVDNIDAILNRIGIYLSTSGSTGSYCTIETAVYSSSSTSSFTVIADKISVSGWPGFNIINIPRIRFGPENNNDTSRIEKIRFTFGCDTFSNTSGYYGLFIQKIFGFGTEIYTAPSTMAKTGHLYDYDYEQNAIFPGKLTLSGHNSSIGSVITGSSVTKSVPNTTVTNIMSISIPAGSWILVGGYYCTWPANATGIARGIIGTTNTASDYFNPANNNGVGATTLSCYQTNQGVVGSVVCFLDTTSTTTRYFNVYHTLGSDVTFGANIKATRIA